MGSNHIQQGLIMVKPHAVELGLDPVVEEVLKGQGLAAMLAADDPLVATLEILEVGSPVIRDLRDEPRGLDAIQMFYGDKSDRRYYPLILERYVGKVAFMPFVAECDETALCDVNNSIKGTTATYNTDGSTVDPSRGLRGLLGEPYLFADRATSDLMDDETYREHFLPVIDNFVHVCDKPGEPEQAAGMLAIDLTQ